MCCSGAAMMLLAAFNSPERAYPYLVVFAVIYGAFGGAFMALLPVVSSLVLWLPTEKVICGCVAGSDSCGRYCGHCALPSTYRVDVHRASTICVGRCANCRLDVSSHRKLRVAVVVFWWLRCPCMFVLVSYACHALQTRMCFSLSAETLGWLGVCVVSACTCRKYVNYDYQALLYRWQSCEAEDRFGSGPRHASWKSCHRTAATINGIRVHGTK